MHGAEKIIFAELIKDFPFSLHISTYYRV